ncbi:hypothetical protein H6G76_31065 [Nostoc sp. FACHB-152]|uniref:hypothetical protein n=1 Tax=Nostoc sp. FACHB-152 TaxID=2692837 RepID=UPI00168614A5|nr:hypothetical protein [Nostoc sp. FACHB-152]MBD2451479.1 hypothetical protein [Nostoc sp. FACHB-152]
MTLNLITPDEISRYSQGLKLQAVANCDRPLSAKFLIFIEQPVCIRQFLFRIC